MLFVRSVAWLFLLGCQYQCKLAIDWKDLSPKLGTLYPTHSPLWGSFLFMHTLCRTTTEFDVVTRGRGFYIGVIPRLLFQDSRLPALPNFLVLLYFCIHP